MRKVFLTLLILVVVSPCLAKYSGGSGTMRDPYQITNVDDLLALAENTGDYGKCFSLTADIDLDPNLPGNNIFTTAVIAPDTDVSNKGLFDGVPFSGVFDGRGHIIYNLTIDTNGAGNDFLGLFGNIDGGEVKNLGIENVRITGGTDTWYSGGLVGIISEGEISSCYTTGEVAVMQRFSGGFVGRNWGSITNCYSTAAVTGGGTVFYIGGFAGLNSTASISNCYSTGVVTAGSGSANIGGFAGLSYLSGSIIRSFFLVTSGSSNGCGAPLTDDQMKHAVNFENWNLYGAFWTINEGVDYPKLGWSVTLPVKYSGGRGQTFDPYQIATAQDLLALSADANDFNRCFILTADIDLDPNLPGNKVFDRAVIAPDTNLSPFFQGVYFTGVFDGMGHKIFNLTIDANDIRNDSVGFFGSVLLGEIKNLGIENVNIICRNISYDVGGLAGGSNAAIIRNCYSTGTIIGINCAGGLVGYNGKVGGGWDGREGIGEISGIISNCYSACSVTGGNISWYMGGMVGYNSHGPISDCYSTGDVNTGFNSTGIGGFVGYDGGDYDSGSIVCCYSIGLVTAGSGSARIGGFAGTGTHGYGNFFLNTSGPDNGKGHPLSDEEMKHKSMFLSWGWDFVWETRSGFNDVWAICEGVSYPKLAWQFKVGDTDNDKNVDFTDFASLANKWMQDDSNLYCGGADLTGDGIVDIEDIAVFAGNWLE